MINSVAGAGAEIGIVIETATAVVTNLTPNIPQVPARSTPHPTHRVPSIGAVAPRTTRTLRAHPAAAITSHPLPSDRLPHPHLATNPPHTKNTSPVHLHQDRIEIKTRKGKRIKVAATTVVAVHHRRRKGKIMIGGGIVIVTNQIHPEVRKLKRSRTITTRAKRSQSSAGALIPMMRVSLPVPAVRLKSPSPRLLLLRRNLMRLWRMAMARMETPMVAAMV